MAYYVLDENKNLVQSFDREGFLAILEQAIEQGTLENIDEDSAVASKLRSTINGTYHHIEFVTAAQYSELETRGELVEGTYYFITDDTTEEDLEAAISSLADRADSLETRADSLETRADSLETDVEDLQDLTGQLFTEVGNLQGIFEFESAYDGFSVLTRFHGSTIEMNNLPSRGLYVLYIYQEGYSGRSISLIMYYDNVSDCFSPLFKYQFYYSGDLQSVDARIKIYSYGSAVLDYVDTTPSNDYTIMYRKIG